MASRRSRRESRWLIAAATAISPTLAVAQDTPPIPPPTTPAITGSETSEAATSDAAPADASTIIYTPADFARFAPRSAFDMVDQIPDFTITETSDARGLGQASQNVLVNGRRVAGKSNDAETTLGRIAASSVIRIEVVDGARLGIPGLTGRVANVIVRASSLSVQARWEGQLRQNIPDQWTSGSIAASGRIGATDFSLSLSNDQAIRRLAGSIRREWGDGSILNLNAAGELYRFNGTFAAVATPRPTGTIRDEFFRQTEDEWNVELGGDYEFAIGGGRLKLIGLQRFERSPIVGTFTRRDRTPGAATSGSRFTSDTDEGESVLRAEYGWGGAGNTWQFAVEAAYNFNDTTSRVGGIRPDGSFALAPFPGGDTFVDEWRSEAQLTRGWTLAPGLTLQTSIGAETSRIRLVGAGGDTRRFVRPKGSASLAWTASPRLTINAGIERRVGQLSFDDFSAGVDVQDSVSSAANTQLVPDQSWRVSGELVRSFGSAGSVTLGGYHEWITDIVDRIPISATEEGVGNLPSARRYGVTARGTLLFDGLGWRGVRLNFTTEFAKSSVRDPVTARNRPISNDTKRDWMVDFRHDIPNTQWAWGGSLGEELDAPTFRLDQISEERITQPFSSLFIENKNVLGLTVRLSFRNLLGLQDDNRRDVYVARRDGPIEFRERQLRRIGPIVVLIISGSF
jgi:outer membrane receptor for ferrienterochelin and colicins